jgi:hypothetical protein
MRAARGHDAIFGRSCLFSRETDAVGVLERRFDDGVG